jgi:peroxiredoxin
MKKINKISILLLVSLCIISCGGKKGKVKLSGEIRGLTTNVIYLYGENESFNYVDTIVVKDGRFNCNINVDTLSSALLLINNEEEYPIFFRKGDRIRIKGDARKLADLEVRGNDANDDFDDFKKELAHTRNIEKLNFTNMDAPDKAMQSQVESFILSHTSSIVSTYLLDRFFVHQSMPDYPRIDNIIKKLNSSLRNTTHIAELSDYINRWKKSRMGAVAPIFTLPDNKGAIVSRTSNQLNNKYILISFWASWANNRAQSSAEMRQFYNSFHNNPKFAMLDISLDTDKAEWKRCIQQDSLKGVQACDLCGFNSPVINQYAVVSLPAYFLIAPDGIILARDMQGEMLRQQIVKALK